MKNMAHATGTSQSRQKSIQNHLLLFCVIFSLVVHLLVVITFFALEKACRRSGGGRDSLLPFSTIEQPRVEAHINITQTSPLRFAPQKR